MLPWLILSSNNKQWNRGRYCRHVTSYAAKFIDVYRGYIIFLESGA